MKITLTILLFMIVSFAKAQTVFKMQMNVREMNHNTEIECTDSTEVIWGIKEDTLAFAFKDKLLIFYPTTRAAWKDGNDERVRIRMLAAEQSVSGDRLYLLQDDRNEKYTVRILSTDRGLLISIVNIDYGYPNYLLGFNCNACLAQSN